ncbi:MAG: hypothetical protein LC777_05230, partial [Actinobacteria bacterium]|nr:hypothetical protein [Actinomycetota bacterium]
ACMRGLSGGSGSSRRLRGRRRRAAVLEDRLLAVDAQRLAREDDVRVETAYNRMLGLPRAWVRDVQFCAEGTVVTVALRHRRAICAGCGAGCRCMTGA